MAEMEHLIGIRMVRATVSHVDEKGVRTEPAGVFKLTLTLKTGGEESLEREFLCVEGETRKGIEEKLKAMGAVWG